jgi:hypothetical protein
MDTEAEAVVRVIARAKGRAGERFAIVQLNDGRLSITQNEQVLQTVRFPSSDVESCVREFVRRTGIGLDDDT